jgi:tetratricopeptide (TPR) repeat protein
MRYVPNLIPDNRRVLKDYFKGGIYRSRKQKPLLTIGGWLLGILFLLWSFPALIYPPLSLVCFLLGISLFPPGHNLIEKIFRFRWTTKIKTIFCTVLFVLIIPFSVLYGHAVARLTDEEIAKEQQQQQAKIAAENKEIQRKDSLNTHIQSVIRLEKTDRLDEAAVQLRLAHTFAATQADSDLIAKTDTDLILLHTFDLVHSGQYIIALPQLTTLIGLHSGNADLRYNRALCYSRLGKIPEAVLDCDTAALLGDSAEAEALNDRINPVTKHIAYYETRCCDGTTSDATGRGACSHHGGVCDWHAPVYEESRKYE